MRFHYDVPVKMLPVNLDKIIIRLGPFPYSTLCNVPLRQRRETADQIHYIKLGIRNPKGCLPTGLKGEEETTPPGTYISNTEERKTFGEFKLSPLSAANHIFWQVNYVLMPHSVLMSSF